MSVLSDFEDRLSRAVEGMFAGVFRSPVQPAELAKACGKEMDRRRKLGVGKVYAPTLYSVLLSPADAEQLGGFTDTLAGELETYVIGYAREREYDLATRPRVRFLVDEGLKLGRFEVIGELLSADEIAAELGEDDAFASDDDLFPAPAAAPAAAVAPMAAPASAAGVFDAELHDAPASFSSITVRGLEHDIILTGQRMVIGRLKSCDICLADANASREHAALELEAGSWVVADLGSTNGTLLNGKPVDRSPLRDGDRITVGVTELVFNQGGRRP